MSNRATYGLVRLSVMEFRAQFKPIENLAASEGELDACIFQCFGADEIFIQQMNKSHPSKIWTVTLTDDRTIITNGFHLVNRTGYFVCEIPVDSNVVYEVTDDEDGEQND